MIARNLDEFTEKTIDVIVNGLNKTEEGKQIMTALLNEKLANDPDMTPEQWQQVKQQFLVYVFHKLVRENDELMHEMASHFYNEIREKKPEQDPAEKARRTREDYLNRVCSPAPFIPHSHY